MVFSCRCACLRCWVGSALVLHAFGLAEALMVGVFTLFCNFVMC